MLGDIGVGTRDDASILGVVVQRVRGQRALLQRREQLWRQGLGYSHLLAVVVFVGQELSILEITVPFITLDVLGLRRLGMTVRQRHVILERFVHLGALGGRLIEVIKLDEELVQLGIDAALDHHTVAVVCITHLTVAQRLDNGVGHRRPHLVVGGGTVLRLILGLFPSLVDDPVEVTVGGSVSLFLVDGIDAHRTVLAQMRLGSHVA